MTEYGAVTAQLVPTVPLAVRGPSGTEQQVTAVVDTGFSGGLSLPPNIVSALGLKRVFGDKFRLADGTVRLFAVYRAEAFWCGEWVDIRVSALGTEVLLGMAMLAGRGLWVEAYPGGVVEVRPLGNPTN